MMAKAHGPRRWNAALVSLLVGTTLAVASPARADDSSPWSVPTPSVARPDSAGVQMRVLTDKDIDLYRDIFRVQERGDWAQADRLKAQVSNDVLMGYVEFQRYMHPTAYTSKYSELRDWLALYADHPEASRIYKLAMRRKPGGVAAPQKPLSRKFRDGRQGTINPAFTSRGAANRRVAEINRYVKSLLARERPTQALGYVNDPKVRNDLRQADYDQILGWIARQYFLERVPDKALRTATEVTGRSREAVPLADWIAGLAAWQKGDTALAASHFDALARAPYAGDELRTAGAYWAARAYLVARQPDKVTQFLEIAARAPLTFYGVLANRQLGNDSAYDWKTPSLTSAGVRRLQEIPAVRRAVALAQLGRRDEAETELRRAHGHIAPNLDADLIAVAAQWDLPATQLQVAEYTTQEGLEAGLYPVPSFRPDSGFQIDPALVFAFIRKESKFVTRATSWAGARGLMQLMPRTASFVAQDSSLRNTNRERLYDPGFNLDLGQKYLRSLMREAEPEGNLFMVAVAYNGGPGNLRKWINELDSNSDPLFFIESIPSRETRDFIEEVLTNLWIYRHRLGQATPTLDGAAAGEWPIYQPLGTRRDQVASR